MNGPVNRREFLTTSAALAAGVGFGVPSAGAQDRGGGAGTPATTAPAAPPVFKTKLQKALIAQPTEKDLIAMKEAGFHGVEGRVIAPDEAAKIRVIAEKIGMQAVASGACETSGGLAGGRTRTGGGAPGAAVRLRARHHVVARRRCRDVISRPG